MKFSIITHAIHKKKEDQIFSYEPYVREMNLWLKNVTETKIVSPIIKEEISAIETNYIGNKIELIGIPEFNILSVKEIINAVFKIPIILIRIYKAMQWADHIHLRCPGNIGMLGALVQVLFPSKPKTVKYAGNWDPNDTNQPLSYRFQKRLLSNTFFTKNCKVLVYGEWGNQTKNIVPFFTASYREKEIIQLPVKTFKEKIRFIYVGAFTKGKQPIISVKTVEELFKKGYQVELSMFGDGTEFSEVETYVKKNKLTDIVLLKGNQPKEKVKLAFQESQFLIFISKSEGWPKVVAEAMFWSCLPISTKVSCIPYMLDNGNRGSIVSNNIEEITKTIKEYLDNFEKYTEHIEKAKNWSQKYTLDAFEKEISKLI
ncbi:glycosyltransferase [Polaribacter atrinae]|uniref:glycosyltransferase n=1 Tax=Polaribacter atrinae TaxID=1333662 RepID=UPI0030FBAF04